MQTRSGPLVLVLGALLLLVGGGAYWVLSFEPVAPEAAAITRAVEPTPPGADVVGGDAVVAPRALDDRQTSASAETSVLWPLVVQLDLESPSYLPKADDGALPGGGRRARIRGRIADAKGEPVAAQIEFVHGANQGRVLLCDSTGAFGAGDLYPGLAIVEVRGPGIRGSRREVMLRQNTEFLLNIGYGRPGAVQGEVLDVQGEPIADAQVWVDGHFTRTDEEGYFFLGGLASDRALLEIEADGYAGRREVVGITADFTIPRGRLVYKLEPATTLTVSLKSQLGANTPAQVVVLPSNTRMERKFPWYRVNPIEVRPGSVVDVPNLPAGPVVVRVFHAGAVATPGDKLINLRSGQENLVEVTLEPAPLLRGTVVSGGEPVPGARVRLEAPDRVGATLAYFRTAHWFLESVVLPPFPFAVQETVADGNGAFSFSSWAEVSPTRYLEARSADGSLWTGRMVGPDDTRVTLELSGVDHGNGELVLALPGRTQGLDVELTINGTPAEPLRLGPDDDLVVDDLLEGTWRVRASWYDEPVVAEREVEVEGSVRIEGSLPEGAIQGQDPDTWQRAGREPPAALAGGTR